MVKIDKLVIDNLSKKYGDFTALDRVSLEIEKGMFGLLGPNGAGKTTLMRILATLIKATEGKISLGNIKWQEPNRVKEIIGYLPQKFSLYSNLTVFEALCHIATLKGVEKDKITSVEYVMDKVNITEYKDKQIGKLSGGMVRRLGIAQAILGNPRIIIVDEPTAGLDPKERIRFRNLLQIIGEDRIVIISTHIVEDVEATCEKLAILNKGKVVLSDSINNIVNRVRGKVFELSIEGDKTSNIYKNFNVISNKREEGKNKFRILSNKKVEEALLVEPTLQDSYLYITENNYEG